MLCRHNDELPLMQMLLVKRVHQQELVDQQEHLFLLQSLQLLCGSRRSYYGYEVALFQKPFQCGQRAMRQCDHKLFHHQLLSEQLALST